MTENPIDRLKKRLQENKRSLNIARLPDKTKEQFVNLANDLFVGDYGFCLKWCLDQALEYQMTKNTFFQNIDFKLDNILEIISQTEQKEEQKPETKTIKLVNGKRIELEGGVKNG